MIDTTDLPALFKSHGYAKVVEVMRERRRIQSAEELANPKPPATMPKTAEQFADDALWRKALAQNQAAMEARWRSEKEASASMARQKLGRMLWEEEDDGQSMA